MKKSTVLLVLLFAFLPMITFAQKDLSEKRSEVIYGTSSSVTNNDVVQRPYVNQEKENLILQEINTAKLNGNIARLRQLEQDLENLTGNKSVNVTEPNLNGPHPTSEVVNMPVPSPKYNYTAINTDANWANANSTDRISGRIWVASTAYNAAGSDTLKLYSSTTGGATWTLFTKLSFGATGIHYRNDELDIEAMNDSTAGGSYLYVTAGFGYTTSNYSFIMRMKADGTGFFFSYLYSSTATAKYIYPRITSDNAKYTLGAYVYNVLTKDSNVATIPATHNLMLMYMLITNPFAATPTITYRNNNTGIGNYYWYASGMGDTSVMSNDIGYCDSAGFSRIITATTIYKTGGAVSNNIFMTRSVDYGVTLPTGFQITEANVNYVPRLAFQGRGAPNGMLTYTRRFAGTDWDPYYQRTSDGGYTWTTGYVDGTSDICVYSDVISVTGAINTFRFAYAHQIGVTGNSNVFVRPYNNGTFLATNQVNPIAASINYSPVRAGYRYAADSCFASWSVGGTNSLNVTAGCGGTVTGVGNNGIPVSYSLSQNYPNPFNPSTRISYSLPKDGLVKITVFDVLGKEVTTLVNNVQTAGAYVFEFNASSLTSGIYFYKLEAGNFVDTKKMVLIK